MAKSYRHRRFPTDEEFLAYHEERAKQGDEHSLAVVETRARLEQAALRRQTAAKREEEKEPQPS